MFAQDLPKTSGSVSNPEELLSNARVLVIDDSSTVRRSAENLLRALGCQVLFANDGFEALAKVVEYAPDLILIDVMMPRMNGYATGNMLKRNPRFRHIPVIMLSGNDGLFDQARGLISGADDYLVKPFTRESLLNSLAGLSIFKSTQTLETNNGH